MNVTAGYETLYEYSAFIFRDKTVFHCVVILYELLTLKKKKNIIFIINLNYKHGIINLFESRRKHYLNFS